MNDGSGGACMHDYPFSPIHAGMTLLSFMRATGNRALQWCQACQGLCRSCPTRLLLSLGCGELSTHNQHRLTAHLDVLWPTTTFRLCFFFRQQ